MIRLFEGVLVATQFWWVTTNPKKRWSWASIFEKPGKEEFFEKRKIEEHFDHAKVGDFIFGYHAVEKQMVALAWVRKGLHTIKADGQHYKGILLSGIGKGLLVEPVPWKILSKQLLYSEPVRHNVQGTLFRLSLEEAKKIIQLIIRAGNRILLPARLKHINKLLLPNKDAHSNNHGLSKERSFAEGEQRAGSTIVRNPALRAAAKKEWGMNCFCCGFNFEHFYSEIGKNFAIVHH